MTVHPHRHRCDSRTIDYSDVQVGHLHCTVCGRRWYLVPGRGWSPDPVSRYAPPRD